MATKLLWLGVTMCQMACLLPQDDDLIVTGELPEPANRPLRILQKLSKPEQRETTVRLASNCGMARTTFSVGVDDPDPKDTIRAEWFIDPDERYLGGVGGNPGVLTSGTIRQVTANVQFTNVLGSLVDGRKHRVEVVVTDGDFVDVQLENVTSRGVKRDPAALPDGGSFPVAAYRDEFVWLVEVLPCP